MPHVLPFQRAQLYARPSGARRPAPDGGTFEDYAFAGIVEMPIGTRFVEGGCYTVMQAPREKHLLVAGRYQQLEPDNGEGLGALATQPIWPRLAPEHCLGAGGIMFRRTRAPAQAGSSVCLMLIVATLHNAEIAEGDFLEMRNACANVFNLAKVTNYSAAGRGVRIDQLWREPIWGFADEPFAFQSTMTLGNIDKCMRILELQALAEISDAEAAELNRLEKDPIAWAVRHNDPQYERFRAMLVEREGFRHWAEVMTKSNCDRRSRISDEIMRQLLADQP